MLVYLIIFSKILSDILVGQCMNVINDYEFLTYFVAMHAFRAFFWRTQKTCYWNSGQTFGTRPERKTKISISGVVYWSQRFYKPMCILMISIDPFKFENGPCPKSPRVGGMHSGVTLDMWNMYITLKKRENSQKFTVQKGKINSVVFLHCVSFHIHAYVQTGMRIHNDVHIPVHIPDFSECTIMGHIPWWLVFKLLYWGVSW